MSDDYEDDYYECEACLEEFPENEMAGDLDFCVTCYEEIEAEKAKLEATYTCQECERDYPGKKMLNTFDICVSCAERLETKRTNVVPLSRTEWSDRMALDLALILEGSGDQIKDLLDHYRITKADLVRFGKDKVFNVRVAHFRREIATEGLGFRMKARVQAEELLTTSWKMIHDPLISANVRSDLIKSTVKWAGLEPKPDALESGGGGGGAGVRISINLANANQPVQVHATGETYDHEPAAIAQE